MYPEYHFTIECHCEESRLWRDDEAISLDSDKAEIASLALAMTNCDNTIQRMYYSVPSQGPSHLK